MEFGKIEVTKNEEETEKPLPLRINDEIGRISGLLEATNSGGRTGHEPGHLRSVLARLLECKTEKELTRLQEEAHNGVDGGRQDSVETRLDDLR